MKNIFYLILLFILSCSPGRKLTQREIVNFSILQYNDFYEIAGIEGETVGGAARIATLNKKVLKESPNLLTVLAGDFLSPSLIGTLTHEGEKIRGRQMVEVLNEIGIDLVAFGNHEFDYDQNTLQKRLNESKFDWVSSNVLEVKDGKTKRFSILKNNIDVPIPTNRIYTYKNENGKLLRVGVISPCIDANKVKYVQYEDIFTTTERELKELEGKVDFIICLSHLNKEQDFELAKRFPKVNLILGGHEHENMMYNIGKVRMTKADANAKSAYLHRIKFNTRDKNYELNSELIKLNSSIPKDEKIWTTVQKWKAIETRIIRNLGFEPEEIIPGDRVNYNSSETIMRNKPSNFGEMICNAMLATCKSCDCAIINSGISRLEDDLSGIITQYDILKAFPFAGFVAQVEIKGATLIRMLKVGLDNKGKGGFLQWAGISKNDSGEWLIQKKLIQPEEFYTIMLNEYLLTGQERGLDFIHKSNPDIRNIIIPDSNESNNLRRDIRMVVIDYLKKGGR